MIMDASRLMEQLKFSSKVLAPYIGDPAVVEIMVNPPNGEVWVDRLGAGLEDTGLIMRDTDVMTIISLVATFTRTTVTENSPIISGELPDGSRFEGLVPPIVQRATFTIRKHAAMVLTLDNYVEKGNMSVEQKDFIETAIHDRQNILVVGGTGCHAPGTKILMFGLSTKKVEDIQIGDTLLGPDYERRTVVALHSGSSRMVKLVLSTGESHVVNEDHLLSLTTEDFDIVTLSVRAYEGLSLQLKRKMKLWRSVRNMTSCLVDFTVEDAGFGLFHGFELDGDHLYMTEDFTVHHNSGKTTLVNAIVQRMSELTPEHRVISIEDTRELKLSSPNAVSLRTSDSVDMTRLLKSCMRLRPDRILVGEVRDAAALALLKAWNTGHPGGLSTVHANDALAGLTRLEQLVQEAGIPDHAARPIIAEAVNILVYIQKTATGGKKIKEILVVDGLESGKYVVHPFLGKEDLKNFESNQESMIH